jgi:hypothetical protein
MPAKQIAEETHQQRAQIICQIVKNEFARLYNAEQAQPRIAAVVLALEPAKTTRDAA